jgi:hypothetical protein
MSNLSKRRQHKRDNTTITSVCDCAAELDQPKKHKLVNITKYIFSNVSLSRLPKSRLSEFLSIKIRPLMKNVLTRLLLCSRVPQLPLLSFSIARLVSAGAQQA